MVRSFAGVDASGDYLSTLRLHGNFHLVTNKCILMIMSVMTLIHLALIFHDYLTINRIYREKTSCMKLVLIMGSSEVICS